MVEKILYSLFLFILGSAIGSFLNVLIDRLSTNKSITGRSHCDHCQQQIIWHDLFPIVSFLFLKGKCRFCHKKLSFYYPIIEIITGFTFITTFFIITNHDKTKMIPDFRLWQSNIPLLIIYLGIFSSLIVIFFADLKYQIIPDSMQVALLVFSLLFQIMSIGLGDNLSLYLFGQWISNGLLVMLPILFLFLITKGNGMGFGDVKLSFIIGFFLGLKGGLIALYLGFIIGALGGVILILFKRKGLKSKIAFGPFLVMGMVMVMIWGSQIFEIIHRLYGF